MGSETIFSIGQTVTFTSQAATTPQRTGKVIGIYADEQGASFNVEYLDYHGVFQRQYFTASQLTAA